MIMSFPEVADPDVGYVESITDARYLEQEIHLRAYRQVWGMLVGRSVPLEEYLAMSDILWIKAPAGGSGGACIEVRRVGDVIELRDGRHPTGPVLGFTPREWVAWLDGAKKGEFDHLSR